MRRAWAVATGCAVLAVLLVGCAINECGPNSPTGPCEIECKPKNCDVGTYCCADAIGGCCDEGWSCVDDGTPEGHCDPPWPEAGKRRARRR